MSDVDDDELSYSSFHDIGKDDDVNETGDFLESEEDPSLCAPGNEQTGRWTRAEHEIFLEALRKFGREWKKVAAMVKTRTVVQTRTHAQKYFQKFSKFEAISSNTFVSAPNIFSNDMTNSSIDSSFKPLKRNAINGTKRFHKHDDLEASWTSPSLPFFYDANIDDKSNRTSFHAFADESSFSPPLSIPQPSPAACGKRKHAELAAAKMLASSSSPQDFEGAQVLSMMKGTMSTSKSYENHHHLVINPDVLSTSGEAFEPSTPWDVELQVMNSKLKYGRAYTLSSSMEIQTFINTIQKLVNEGEIDKLEKALRDLNSMEDNLKGLITLSKEMAESPLTVGKDDENDMSVSNPPVKLGSLTDKILEDSPMKSIMNSSLGNGRTLVLEACVSDFDDDNEVVRLEICRILLDVGCSILSVDTNGNNCLHLAASKGFARIGRFFINNGSPINAVNIDGDSAMHIAASFGFPTFLQMLVQFGADCHLTNKQNFTALAVAGNQSKLSRGNIRDVMLKAEPRLRTLVVYHQDCLEHSTRSTWDWEGPDRLRDIMTHLLDRNEFKDHELLISSQFEKASLKLLHRVHSSEYIAFVDSLSKQVQSIENDHMIPFTPQIQKSMLHQPLNELKNAELSDTTFSVGTLQAARRAAGAVAHAVDHVLMGRSRNAFCVVRPPGHHAGFDGLLTNAKSCGFCIFNNVAAGALHALEEHNCERVAIIDVDIHHGNGTEDIVRRYPHPSRLFFFSVHLYDRQDPSTLNTNTDGQVQGYEFFPGSGEKDDIVHNIINVPLEPNWKRKKSDESSGSSSSSSEHQPSGRELYRQAILKRLVPSLRAFNPSLILISMGFDGASGDIGNIKTTGTTSERGMDLEIVDFEWITTEILKIADLCCGGRVVSVLEGGYGSYNTKKKSTKFNRSSTRSSSVTTLEVQDDPSDAADEPPISRYTLSSSAAGHVRKLIDPFNVKEND